MNCSTPGLAVHHQLLSPPKPMSIELVMPSNHLILCRPLLLLPSIFPRIRVFSNESALRIRWPGGQSIGVSASTSVLPMNEHPGLISFRMDWLDLLAVQGALKSLLQHHSSKASILQRSAFFIVQLSHLYMTTGKTIALTRWTFVGKVMSLLFNMLSRLVISPLTSSSILGIYRPREFLFQYPIILPFHTVHGVLKARLLKWFAIPFSSGPRFVRTLHHDPSILGNPTQPWACLIVSWTYTRLWSM